MAGTGASGPGVLGLLSGQLRHPGPRAFPRQPGPGEHRCQDSPRVDAAPPGGRAESRAGRDRPPNLPSCLLTRDPGTVRQVVTQARDRATPGRGRPRISRRCLPTTHHAPESPRERARDSADTAQERREPSPTCTPTSPRESGPPGLAREHRTRSKTSLYSGIVLHTAQARCTKLAQDRRES